jgi:hypothetical protein
MNNAVLLAFSGISDPDRADEYNEWYDRVHAVQALKTAGVLSCRRYKLAADQMMPSDLPQYLAIYEVDPAVLNSLPAELASKFASGDISMHDLMAEGTVAMYEMLSEPTL